MSYIPAERRIDQLLSSQGDGTGVTDIGVDGKTVTGASIADPSIVTATAHGYVTGDWIWIDGATGTTEINGLREVVKINANTFTLLDEAGAAVSTIGTFGGTVDSNIALVIKPSVQETFRLVRLNVAGSDNSWSLDGLMGVSRLSSRGLSVDIYNGSGLHKHLASIFGWNDWSLYTGGGDSPIQDITNNKYEAASRWTFSRSTEGMSMHDHDIMLRGSLNEMFVVSTDEDLAAINSLRFAVQGHTS